MCVGEGGREKEKEREGEGERGERGFWEFLLGFWETEKIENC